MKILVQIWILDFKSWIIFFLKTKIAIMAAIVIMIGDILMEGLSIWLRLQKLMSRKKL